MPRILLVEDSFTEASRIEHMLTEARTAHVVSCVETLATALTVLRNLPVDVVLLDLTLSDSSGVETVIAIRREAPDTPIIVLSPHEDVAVALLCVSEGAQSFMVKATLTSEALDREVLFTIERNRKMGYVRKLLKESLRHHKRGAAILAAHVGSIESAVDELNDYLRRNSPVSYEAVDAILVRHGVRDVLQELRSLTVDSENQEVTALHYATTAMEGLHTIMQEMNASIVELAARNALDGSPKWLLLTLGVALALCGILVGVLWGSP